MVDQALVFGIRERYQRVIEQIAEAMQRSGREDGKVRLVVVTKSQPLGVVRAAIAAGALILGESYADEAVTKISSLSETAVEWHMIGHVQSRKAELIIGNFSLLHSLDSVKLARRLDRFCDELGQTLPVLLEANVGGEESKFGFPAWEESRWQDLETIFGQIMEFSNLQIRGFMTMPPFFDDPEQSRPYFKRLRRLQIHMEKCFPQTDWTELSMGTSPDYITAVEEGATYVRVGKAILGPRPV